MANTIKNDMSNNQEVMDSIVGKTIGSFSDDKLRKVGKNAFRGCSSLSSAELPNVRSISDRAFKDCSSLRSLTVGLNYDGVTVLGDNVFDGCENLGVVVPMDKVDSYRNSDAWSDFVKREDGVIVEGPGSKGFIEGFVYPLGGKIFYIDPSDNGATYSFYDENKNEIIGWTTFSDLANAKYYFINGTPSKDKVYVYYPTKYDSLQWGYRGTSIGTGTAVGTGKTNTEKVMSRSDIPSSSIWSKLSEIRASSGIDDWFVPSKGEIDKFREADLEPWHRSSGGSYLWSSSESAANGAWYWNYAIQNWSSYGKYGDRSVFFVRAF